MFSNGKGHQGRSKTYWRDCVSSGLEAPRIPQKDPQSVNVEGKVRVFLLDSNRPWMSRKWKDIQYMTDLVTYVLLQLQSSQEYLKALF